MSDDFELMKKKYLKAKSDYNKGISKMTDDDFDDLENKIRLMFPEQLEEDDFTQITDTEAPDNCVDKEKLPCLMPSLKKIKTNHELFLWLSKHVPNETSTCTILPKYDGTSGLWIPGKNKLMTRYNGIDGRDISIHVPNIKGLISNEKIKDFIIRGEIMIRKDSSIVLESKSGSFRNVGCGIVNMETPDEKAKHLTFFAYEICSPSHFTPSEQIKILEENGFTTIKGVECDIKKVNEEFLVEAFENLEKEYQHYGFDGVVICPNFSLEKDFQHEIRNKKVVLPENKRAWKVRKNQKRYVTTVTSVEWNTKTRGKLVPVINYETVNMEGIKNNKATGHNAKVIYSNYIGKGAKIIVVRANDTIPKLEGIISKAEAPEMPTHCEWEWDENNVQIFRKGVSDEENISTLKKSLELLGAEKVGPATIASLYKNKFDTVQKIYAADAKKFLCLDRAGDATALNIYNGLRKKQSEWEQSDWMAASMCFPEFIGKTKLNLIFSIESDWTKWNFEELNIKRPKGLTSETLQNILDCIPDYMEWFNEMSKVTGFVFSEKKTEQKEISNPCKIVFTGFRSEELEKQLLKMGHIIQTSVNGQTKLIIYKNTGKESSSLKKGKELNIRTIDQANFDINTFDFDNI